MFKKEERNMFEDFDWNVACVKSIFAAIQS